MQFNSYEFILFFCPITFMMYFVSNRINYVCGKIVLIIASFFFYAYATRWVSFVLVGSMGINYIIYTMLTCKIIKRKKIFLNIGIVANISLLFLLKYFDFLIDCCNRIFFTNINQLRLMLPLAISFFTFQQIMFIVEVYKGSITRASLIDYILYVLYFPKLISGPLVNPKDIILQFNEEERKKINVAHIASGIRIFGYGLFKKTLLADTFGKAVAWGLHNAEIATSAELFIVMIAYTFEIYFDFSGYCDMGLGISRMFNIELPANFNSPYKSKSIRDFWGRWHISLTNFFTHYIYIPLGGSRVGAFRTCVNTMVVFVVSGLWHGANYTFILWGIIHGALSLIDRFTEKIQEKVFEPIRWGVNFIIVSVLWMLFAADSISQWILVLGNIIRCQDTSVGEELLDCFVACENSMIFDFLHIQYWNENVRGFSMILYIVAAFIICLIPENNYNNRKRISYLGAVGSSILFVWAFLSLSSESTFVYFGF